MSSKRQATAGGDWAKRPKGGTYTTLADGVIDLYDGGQCPVAAGAAGRAHLVPPFDYFCHQRHDLAGRGPHHVLVTADELTSTLA
jgi:hypothetical protein